MTTTRTFVAAIAASALLMLSSAEAAPVGDPEGSPVDASTLGAAVLANASALAVTMTAAARAEASTGLSSGLPTGAASAVDSISRALVAIAATKVRAVVIYFSSIG